MSEDIPSRMLTKHNFPDDIEDLFAELNFGKNKWLLCRMYHPPQPDQYFFNALDKALDVYSNDENVILIGDFNSQIGEKRLDTFFYISVSQQISIKNQHIIRAQKIQAAQVLFCPRRKSVFKRNTLFTELTDFHKLVLSVIKTAFPKSKPKEITYRNFKNVSEENFYQELRTNLGEKCKKNYKETVISDDQLISAELNQFFKNATKALNIWENSYMIDKSELSDPVNKAT